MKRMTIFSAVLTALVLFTSLSCADDLNERLPISDNLTTSQASRSSENKMTLWVTAEAGSNIISISWINHSYTDSYVYLWLDGEYIRAAQTDATGISIAIPYYGLHTITLKNGSTASATTLSNTVTVLWQN